MSGVAGRGQSGPLTKILPCLLKSTFFILDSAVGATHVSPARQGWETWPRNSQAPEVRHLAKINFGSKEKDRLKCRKNRLELSRNLHRF
jgi:hypothetical protein